MSKKATIVGVLGEKDLLFPDLVHQALAANGRAKYFFTLLQLARAHADDVETCAPDLKAERELAGIADGRFDKVVADSRHGDQFDYRVPFAKVIVEQLFEDVDAMMAPLRAAPRERFDTKTTDDFERRRRALSEMCWPRGEGTIASDTLGFVLSSERARHDSVHLLVFDLHKAIDALAASVATDEVDGAKVYGLEPADRKLVAAFMKGIHETEALKFEHPGLGTMATRNGPALFIENDIGETSAHVLVIRIEGLRVVVTTSDVHLPRIEFFRRQLESFRVEWADVRSRSLRELQQKGLFYECVGTLDATDRDEQLRFLHHLGRRIVFLIDWNRARKALRAFVSKPAGLALLDWAADQGHGHRGFLEMGGVRLVFDAMAAVLRTPLRFGERLDDVLGGDAALDFMRYVLWTSSEGLRSGRSRSLMRAEIRAELAKDVRAGGERLLGPIAEHAAIMLDMARSLRSQLRAITTGPSIDQAAAARAARESEHRGDALVVMVRGVALRIPDAHDYFRIVELADDAADAVEEGAFLLSLVASDHAAPFPSVPFAELGDLVVDAAEAYLSCVTSAQRGGPEGFHGVLDAFDSIARLEQRMDDAERHTTASLARAAEIDGKLFVLMSRVTSQAERAVDALKAAALLLRDR